MEIREQLDFALEFALTAKEINAKQRQNVMIEGLSGFGKTAIVKQWAKEKDMLLVAYDLSQPVDTIYEEDQFGILKPKKVENPIELSKQLIYSALLKYKDGENFVLLLDNYQMAKKENIEAIKYTIDTHKIINSETNEEIELKNLLFTIVIKTI